MPQLLARRDSGEARPPRRRHHRLPLPGETGRAPSQHRCQSVPPSSARLLREQRHRVDIFFRPRGLPSGRPTGRTRPGARTPTDLRPRPRGGEAREAYGLAHRADLPLDLGPGEPHGLYDQDIHGAVPAVYRQRHLCEPRVVLF